MFEVYAGTGENKQSLKRFDKLNDAILLAWAQHDITLNHHGVLQEGKVIFNTDFSDPEFVTSQ